MKSSFAASTANALRGFAGLFGGARDDDALAETEDSAYVVGACGRRADDFPRPPQSTEPAKWLPGLSLDNFS
jgi:hypothetical protein